VVSFDRHSKAVVGRSVGYAVKTAVRNYAGKLVCVRVGDRHTRTTPNHRWLVRWSDRYDRSTVVVYVMRRGDRFRVGWCQLFTGKGALHLGRRSLVEKADMMWVLRVFASRTDASVYESVVAARYGLPTVPFEPVHGACHLTADAIEATFAALDGVEHVARATRCLQDHGRYVDMPLWPPIGKSFRKMGRTTLFETYASNLLPELMALPVPVLDTKDVSYEAITNITFEDYIGAVYSLDVDKHATYIQDGIITHNSIYNFRGAVPTLMRDFVDKHADTAIFPLSFNFRCGQKILDAANGLLKHAPERMFQGTLRRGRVEAIGVTDFAEYSTLADEAEAVVDRIAQLIQDGCDPNGIAVLYRINAQAGYFEMGLISRGVPYRVAGASFFKCDEVRAAIGYLACALDSADGESWKHAVNVPTRYLGRVFLDAFPTVEATREGLRMNTLGRWRVGASQALRAIDDVRAKLKTQGLVAALTYVLDVVPGDPKAESGVRAHFRDRDASDELETDTDARCGALVDLAAKLEGEASGDNFDAARRLVDYARDMAATSREERDGERDGVARVTLSTVHRAKGLEWVHVFAVGWTQGLFPLSQADGVEERRLGYVCATRARDFLSVSCTKISHIGNLAGPSSLVLEAGFNNSGVPKMIVGSA
jgi:DNA helicase II / ATP-dependent DNA helicase PcrA